MRGFSSLLRSNCDLNIGICAQKRNSFHRRNVLICVSKTGYIERKIRKKHQEKLREIHGKNSNGKMKKTC